MAPFDYNDIRNDDWYNRLVRGVRESTTASIRRSGADPNDPYWRAKEAEGLQDLSNARQDAFRRAFAAARNRQMAAGASMREKEAARQRTISAALKRDWRPDVGLGTMADESTPSGISSGSPSIPEPLLTSSGPSPEAYPMFSAPDVYARDRGGDFGSAGGGVYTNRAWAAGQAEKGGFNPNPTTAGYNPTVFQDNELNYRKRRLDDQYANLARRWR